MNVVITDEAALDLERIGDAIAVDNPGRAITFVRELRVSCESLGEFPKLIPWCLDMKISACVGGCTETTWFSTGSLPTGSTCCTSCTAQWITPPSYFRKVERQQDAYSRTPIAGRL